MELIGSYAEELDAWWVELNQIYSEFFISTVGTLIIHEVCYFAIAFPTWLFQFIPYFDRWRIQPRKKWTMEMQLHCLWMLLLNQAFVQVPMIMGTHTLCEMLGIRFGRPYPHLGWLAVKIFLSFVLEDSYHYFMHRLMHDPRYYKYVHKMHHKHTFPFGLVAEYAHPVETVVLGLGTMLGPIIFAGHIFELWAWLVLRLVETIDVHTGYNFPWNPLNYIPFYGGAVAHDAHHELFNCNFSSTFTWWDKLFGTDRKTWEAERKSRGSKGAGKVVSKMQ